MDLLPKQFEVTTILNKRGKYGRILGTIKIRDEKNNEININELLVDEGHAIRYNIGK